VGGGGWGGIDRWYISLLGYHLVKSVESGFLDYNAWFLD
jgi:hypothetical protein